MKLVKQKYGRRLIYNQEAIIQLKKQLDYKWFTLNARKSKLLGSYQLALHYNYPFYVYNNYIYGRLNTLQTLFSDNLTPIIHTNNLYKIPLPHKHKSLHKQYQLAKEIIQ